MTAYCVCLVFFVTSVLSICKIRNKKDYQYAFLLISMALFFVIVFRNGEELNDYEVYVNMYNNYDKSFVILYVEPTFIFFSYLFNHLSLSVLAIFAVYGAISLYLKVSLIKKISPYYYLSLVSYISYEFINQELIAIRAGAAIAILLYSIPYIYKHDFKMFLFLVICATLFHYSSIMAIPIYPLILLLQKNKIYGPAFLGLSILFIFFDISVFTSLIPIPYVRNKVTNYLTRTNISLIHILLRFTILYRYFLLFILSKYKKIIKKHNKYIDIELSFLLYGLILNNVFGRNEVLSYRMSMLFFSVEYLLVPNFVLFIKEKRIAKILVVFLSLMNLMYLILVTHIFH